MQTKMGNLIAVCRSDKSVEVTGGSRSEVTLESWLGEVASSLEEMEFVD